MSSETKKKKQILTIEAIKASAEIPKSFKALLELCPTQEIRPLPLTQWTKKVIESGKKLNLDVDLIIGCVKSYANKGNWSKQQISTILIENGIRRNAGYGEDADGDEESTAPVLYLPEDFIDESREMIESLSSMDYSDILEAKYSPEKIAKSSENTLRQLVSRMNEGDLETSVRWIDTLIALFERMRILMKSRQESEMKFGV